MSGLRHHSRSKFVQLRWDYLALADGNHCAAKILSVLEYRTNQLKMQAAALGKHARQWIYKRLVDWRSELMEEHSVGVIRRALKLLQEKGLIDVTNNFKRNRAGAEFNGQDKTNQYRMNFNKLHESLKTLQDSNLPFLTTGELDSTPGELETTPGESETTNIIEDSMSNFIAHSTADKVAAVAEEEEEMDLTRLALKTQVDEEQAELALCSVVVEEQVTLTTNPVESDQSTDTLCVDEPEQVIPSNETTPHEGQCSAGDEKPSREEIRDICNELRQIPCTPAFRISLEMMTVVNKYWRNVPGAIAYLKEALRTWKRVDSPESVFVSAVKNGKKPESMIIPTNQQQWLDWALKKRIILGRDLANGIVYDPDGRVVQISEMMKMHPMEQKHDH